MRQHSVANRSELPDRSHHLRDLPDLRGESLAISTIYCVANGADQHIQHNKSAHSARYFTARRESHRSSSGTYNFTNTIWQPKGGARVLACSILCPAELSSYPFTTCRTGRTANRKILWSLHNETSDCGGTMALSRTAVAPLSISAISVFAPYSSSKEVCYLVSAICYGLRPVVRLSHLDSARANIFSTQVLDLTFLTLDFMRQHHSLDQFQPSVASVRSCSKSSVPQFWRETKRTPLFIFTPCLTKPATIAAFLTLSIFEMSTHPPISKTPPAYLVATRRTRCTAKGKSFRTLYRRPLDFWPSVELANSDR